MRTEGPLTLGSPVCFSDQYLVMTQIAWIMPGM